MKTYLYLILAASYVITPSLSFAESLPKLRAGFWEHRTFSEDGKQTQSSQRCIDAASEASLLDFSSDAQSRKTCSQPITKKTSAGFEVKTECKVMGSNLTSVSHISGDFESKFTTESLTTMDPPMMGTSRTVWRTESKWLGECPSSFKPGDVSINGRPPVNGIESALKVRKIHDQLRKSDPNFDRLVREASEGKKPTGNQSSGVRVKSRN